MIQLRATTRIEWYAPAVTAAVDAEIANRVYRVGQHVFKKIQENISVWVEYQGNKIKRSKPGEYPRQETSKLRRSVYVQLKRTKLGAEVRLGARAPYAIVLETSLNRSFIQRTWREEYPTIERMLKKPIR